MMKQIEAWGPITTVGELIEQVNNIGDVDPEMPLTCYCNDSIELQLFEDIETGERSFSIDSD